MHWTNKYIGEKFSRETNNCAQLVEKVLQREFLKNIHLPKIEEFETDAMNDQLRLQFRDFCEPIDRTVRDGDIALMKSWNHFNHVGVVAILKGQVYVLHSFLAARQVVLTPVNSLQNYQLSLEGIYECL